MAFTNLQNNQYLCIVDFTNTLSMLHWHIGLHVLLSIVDL
jgi:hypothetical protein